MSLDLGPLATLGIWGLRVIGEGFRVRVWGFVGLGCIQVRG